MLKKEMLFLAIAKGAQNNQVETAGRLSERKALTDETDNLRGLP